jgi:transcriptional regulator with XRE-family HTH domain
MRGKKEVFSPEENSILRAALRKLREERGLSQEALGALLGMTQQTAGRLVSTEGGMGRVTANALARELGYNDAEHYLREVGILALVDGRAADAESSSEREVAIVVARRLEYDDGAVEAVLARYADAETRGRSIRWWLTKFGDEERERAADGLLAPSAPLASPPSSRRDR